MKLKIKAFLTACLMTVAVISASASSIFAEDNNDEKLRVMPLGDSITDGFSTVGGYRTTLCNLLKENGFSDSVDFVGPLWGGDGYDPQHAGYSGYSIDNIPQENSISGQRTGISSFIDWLMTEYPADVVMLQIGTNDILSCYDLDNIGERLESLVDTILTYIPDDGMLYLATVTCMDARNTLYINEYYFTVESMDAYVDAYNTAIREIAARKAAEGKNIALADINGVLTKADLFDGVHPSVGGYAKMGEYWYGQLMSYLSRSGPIVEPTTEPTTEATTEPTTETTTAPPITDYFYNISDLVALSKYLLSTGSLTAEQAAAYDMDKDNLIDVFDLINLRLRILNIPE